MSEIIPNKLANLAGISRQALYNAIRRGQLNQNESGAIDSLDGKNKDWLLAHGITDEKINIYLSENHRKHKSKSDNIHPSNPIPKIIEEIQDKQVHVDPEKIQTVQKYIEKKPEKKEQTEEENFEDVTGLPSKMMSLTLYQLVKQYGGPMMLDSYSKILQRLMGASLQDQKIQERRLELIEKDFVISRLLSYLETLSGRLFDYTESAPIGFIATVKAEIENAEIEIKKKMKKDISILIKDTKENIIRELENLKRKYEKKEIKNAAN